MQMPADSKIISKYFRNNLTKIIKISSYHFYLDSTWGNCNTWKHGQDCFFNDLEPKGGFIIAADRQRVKPIYQLYLHTFIPYCGLDEVQHLWKETAQIMLNSEFSWWERQNSKEENQISHATSCNDCAEWIRRFTYASAKAGMMFTCKDAENQHHILISCEWLYFYKITSCTLTPPLNMVTAVVVLTRALVSGLLSIILQHKTHLLIHCIGHKRKLLNIF